MIAIFLLGWLAAITGVGVGVGNLIIDRRVRWIVLTLISLAVLVPMFLALVAGIESGC